MKAITVIEDEDGVIEVVASGSPTHSAGIDLLHQGISHIARVIREGN